jgi:hypothetical protein
MPLTLQGSTVRNPILDVDDEATARFARLVDFNAILTPVFHPILTPPVGV